MFAFYTYCVYLHSLLQKVLSIVKDCNAGVVELVDTLDLGSSAARCGSSSLPARTANKKADFNESAFLFGVWRDQGSRPIVVFMQIFWLI